MNFKKGAVYIIVFLEVATSILLYFYVSHVAAIVLFGFGVLTLFLMVRDISQTVEYTIPQFFDLISQTDMGQGLQIPNWRDLEKTNRELGHPKIQVEEIDESQRRFLIQFQNAVGEVYGMEVKLLLNKYEPIENAALTIYSPEINPLSPSDMRYYASRHAHGKGIKRAASELARGTGMKPEDVLSAIYSSKKVDKNETNK
jgi:hypothetical protein